MHNGKLIPSMVKTRMLNEDIEESGNFNGEIPPKLR